TVHLQPVPHSAPHSGGTVHLWGVIGGACLISFVGAIDDIKELQPLAKLLGQVAAAIVVVPAGVVPNNVTIPFTASLQFTTTGAAVGFLVHNFPPGKIFRGGTGANLLGLLLAVVAVIGSVKTNVVLALVVPLLILAVPFLDTGFVVAKRLKYGRKPWAADTN